MLHKPHQKLKNQQLQLKQFFDVHQTGVQCSLGNMLNKACSIYYGRQRQIEEAQSVKSTIATLQHYPKGLGM